MAEKVIKYVRKLSGDEAGHGYIMVMKDYLKLFPKPTVPFKLEANGRKIDSEVKVVDCWCQGPKKPHVHYRIDLTPFQPDFRPHYGQTLTIEKVGENSYKITI